MEKHQPKPQQAASQPKGDLAFEVLEDNAQRTVTKLANGTIRVDHKMGKIKFIKKQVDGQVVEVEEGSGGLAIQ
jgi:hypothetical protein